MARKVTRPVRAALFAGEEVLWRCAQRAHHIGLHLAMPGYNLGRRSPMPAFVDEAVAGIDSQAAQLRRALFTAKDPCRVLLPVDNVRQRVLHGPGILAFRPRHRATPIRGLEPGHHPIKVLKLFSASLDDFFAGVTHG